jgi:hypothetical protein
LIFAMQASMAEEASLNAHWKISLGIVTGFCIWILLVSLVALASSAFARIRIVAGGIVLGFFFILSGASIMINGVFRSTWGYAINPSWITRRIWYALLGMEAPTGPSVPACALALSIILLLLVLILERKIRPVEVVS